MSLEPCGLVYVIHYLLQEEIHQEASLMIPLVTRASNSALVSPSTPRNTGGTEHEMEDDGRDNNSVSLIMIPTIFGKSAIHRCTRDN